MHRKNVVLILFVGVLILIIVFTNLKATDRTLFNFITLIGTFLSTFGLLLAYYQILSLKEVSKKTQEAVETSSQQLKKILSIAELSKSKKIIEEIQLFLQNANLSGALIRMKDLKEILIQNKYNKSLEKLTVIKEYRTILINTGIDINSISDSLLKESSKLDKGLIIRNLENTKTKLIEFENVLKFQGNDSR